MGYHTAWGQRLLKLSLVGLLGFLGFIPGLEKLQVLSVFTVLMAVAGMVEWAHKRKQTRASELGPWWHRVLGKIVIALIIVMPLRTWVLQAFVINGKSLEPEMPPGSHMLVWKLSIVYAPGDIVAHRHGDQVWVSRVVRIERDELVLQRNQWPEEKVPHADIIGKVISVYWRASPAMPSVSEVPSPPALTMGPATVDLDKKPQLRFLQYYYRGDGTIHSAVRGVQGRL
jgi:hypothetical protein